MIEERRTNLAQRRLIALGNHLSLWAGIEAKTPKEKIELDTLFDDWDRAISNLRTQNQNNSLRAKQHSDTL